MPIVEVKVTDKIAKNISYTTLVCGNSDYIIHFDFDEEWDAFAAKTARFVWNGQYIDVAFTGDSVQMPIINDTLYVAIGVYAANLHTTTPAMFSTKKSILCDDPVHVDPPEDVYNQIMQLLESGAIKGEDGFSPVVTVEEIEGGHRVTITDAEGDHIFDVMDGQGGGGGSDGIWLPTVSAAGVITWEKSESETPPVPRNIKGADGRNGTDGRDGVDGQDGYTPIKGVDYFDGADGRDGTDGADGADGFSPSASVTKTGSTSTITITDKNGTTTVNVTDGQDGQDGVDGQDGANGQDGYTPVRGLDYWTAADQQQIVQDVLDALPMYEGGSY